MLSGSTTSDGQWTFLRQCFLLCWVETIYVKVLYEINQLVLLYPYVGQISSRSRSGKLAGCLGWDRIESSINCICDVNQHSLSRSLRSAGVEPATESPGSLDSEIERETLEEDSAEGEERDRHSVEASHRLVAYFILPPFAPPSSSLCVYNNLFRMNHFAI